MKFNYTKTTQWAMPVLGLMTAYYWFEGTVTSAWWWLLIAVLVSAGNYSVTQR